MTPIRRCLTAVFGEELYESIARHRHFEGKERYYAQEFEEAHDLNGLSRRYVRPPDWSMDRFDSAVARQFPPTTPTTRSIDPALLEELTDLNSVVVRLNPELATARSNITADSEMERYYKERQFLRGVTSHFNPADIDHFVNNGDASDPRYLAADNKRLSERWEALWPDLTRVSGSHWKPAWRPSPATLDLVEQQVNERVAALKPPGFGLRLVHALGLDAVPAPEPRRAPGGHHRVAYRLNEPRGGGARAENSPSGQS